MLRCFSHGRGKPAEASEDHGKKTEETQSSARTVADEKFKNEHMVYARHLNITWINDERYWKKDPPDNETSDIQYVAELLNVCWLEVGGKYCTKELSKEYPYEVLFRVKMKTEAYGWDDPVDFKFTPPDDTNPTITKIILAEELKDRKDNWQEIKFGEFKRAPGNDGDIEFSLYEHGGNWKSGLVIEGVVIRRKNGKDTLWAASSKPDGKETEEPHYQSFSCYGSEKGCMVYAKGLDITWKDDRRYWQWVQDSESPSVAESPLVAELLNISWLDVRGQLGTKELSPGTLYEVVFVVKMKTKAYGWDAAVNFKFTPPDDTNPTITKIKLAEKLEGKDQWNDIQFGEFEAPKNPGNIEFSLYEHGGKWKRGLVIKGVEVRQTAPLLFFGDGSKKQCMVYAKGLDIAWSEDPNYWQWVLSDGHLAAELLKVSWLEVGRKLDTKELSPGTQYVVVFVVKMKTEADGWDAPVNFKFTPPDGTNPTIMNINLAGVLKDSIDTWKEITFGEFTAPEIHGNIEFSLYEHGGEFKSGLVIKGVAVRPKRN